jgi:preprotein translocase subunit SecG
MSLFIFLTVVQALVAAALVGVILMQRSEGGGLGVGGSPSGLMSARGAADFLTRSTTILAITFVVLSIALAALAVGATSNRQIDTSLDRTVPVAPADPLSGAVPGMPLPGGPLPGASPAPVEPAPATTADDPLASAVRPTAQPTSAAPPTPRVTPSPKSTPRPSPSAAATATPTAATTPTPAPAAEPTPTAAAT